MKEGAMDPTTNWPPADYEVDAETAAVLAGPPTWTEEEPAHEDGGDR